MQEYNHLCFDLSKTITERYSTSFTRGIKTLGKKYHAPVFAIYGFVRLADEIVDTFHGHNKKQLLARFKAETYNALTEKISTNTVLHAFQMVVNKYNIDIKLIDAFLHSMEMDLTDRKYDEQVYNTYIFGSAEVVGLMCLYVFVDGDVAAYKKLEAPARSLGAAFQKVNFLRDMKADFEERGRVYFPGVDFKNFDDHAKNEIEKDIEKDFVDAYDGIMQLPADVRPGVYIAYIYYQRLLQKIKSVPASKVSNTRIRVPDFEKAILQLKTYLKFGFSF